MGKGHRHTKKLKSEKAKVKLKGSKHLPKGTNITDTSFKIKQIVVREQLKAANEAEPLSKRKLNIKELLNRLQHYNTTVKNDAITDLKEIVTLYPSEVVVPNLSQLIQGVSHLILDKEKTVRRESLKLIGLILTQVSVDQIAPFFDILSSYFRCAMTHIDISIQEDSLLLLDTLITYTPSLVAAHSNKIFDNFFDLISKLRTDSKPGRTLTVNLNSKITTVKWRIKVLNRLHAMLAAIINEKNKNQENQTNNKLVFEINVSLKNDLNQFYSENINLKYNPDEKYHPVYTTNYLIPVALNINNESNTKSIEYENNIVKYIDVLVPLLFETWLEVGPNEKKENTDLDVSLTEEAASILNCILNIFQILYNFLKIYEKETGDYSTRKTFITKYGKDYSNFIFSYFPYMKIAAKKRKRGDRSNEPTMETHCVVENLMICNIFCIFNKKIITNDKKQKDNVSQMLNYIQKTFTRWNTENAEPTKHGMNVLKTLLLDVSLSWSTYTKQLNDILISVIELYMKSKKNGSLRSNLFTILCEIVNLEHFNKLPEFLVWLGTLPDLLCQKQIDEKTINMISFLVKQNMELFNKSMESKYCSILENLSNIQITKTNDEINAKCKILGLVHYIPADDIFNYLNIVLKSECDDVLKKYFQEIILLKFEINDLIQADKVRNMEWTAKNNQTKVD